MHGILPKEFRDYLNDLSKFEPPRQIVTLPQPDNPAETWQGAIRRWKETHGLGDDAIEGEWKAIVRFPRERILQKYWRRMWLSSSIAWLILLAIEEGASDIGLWGIDLESGEEYISQFIGCAHYLDLAQLAGINVHLPKACGLLRDPTPYPDRYETNLALTLEKKFKWLEGAIGQLEPQYDDLKAEVHRQEGRLVTLRQLGGDAKVIQETEHTLIGQGRHLGGLAANINQLKGEMSATQFYRRMYVWGMMEP